ncbi:hypothetical protein KY309_00175 [Candidatus Woesearchaeota archaeon]|nr:hypothetical protein [Candidatus Woesearchaeota archaeon]MBW3016008.1 hypothetical protein [Candidatus Woesearchaeota archaeon]
MRISIWIGLPIFAIGILLSYLADAMIQTQTMGVMQTTAALIAAILYIMFSATMLGAGAGLVLHWIFGFASHWKAFIAEIVFSFAIFFVGIGATIMSGNPWTGLQIFFTFLTASATLFILSFTSLFGGVLDGIKTIYKYAKKRIKKR